MSKKYCWPSVYASYIICPHTPGAIVHLRPETRWRWEEYDADRYVVWRGDLTMALPERDFRQMFCLTRKGNVNAGEVYETFKREARREVETGMITNLQEADVVTRDCFDKILQENDAARRQLAEIGKRIGDKMDDVRTMAHAHWVQRIDHYECSECREDCWSEDAPVYDFCPYCGAKMDGGEERDNENDLQ